MRKIQYIAAAFAAMAVFSCSKAELEQAEAPVDQIKQSDATQEPEYRNQVSGSMIVEFDDATLSLIENDLMDGKLVTKSMGLNSALDELNIVSIERLIPAGGEYEAQRRQYGLHRFYVVKYDEKITSTKAHNEFISVKGVVSADPVRKVRRRSVNDTYYSRQWALKNNGSGNFTAGMDINVEPVWNNFTTGDPRVIVAVTDGGVALTHNDLASNALPAQAGGSRNCMKSNYSIDADDHGTHVAGTIAAITNNNRGVAGIAGGDYANNVAGCKVMSCQIFNDDPYDNDNGSDATCIRAFTWARENGAVISQNSWGYYADTDDNGYVSPSEYNAFKNITVGNSFKQAIQYFVDLAGCDANGNQREDSMMKGGVLFFASGNENIDLDPICTQCNVIAVSSFAPDGNKAYYSNYGTWVDLAAPGGDAYVNNGEIYSLAPGNKYAWMQGTSMACPHASGVAALVISYCGGQGFTNQMLVDKMLNGAVSGVLTSSDPIGSKLDAYGAITYGLSITPPAPVANYTVAAVANSIDFSWKVTANAAGTAVCAKYILLASKSSSTLSAVDPKTPGSGVFSKVITVPDGSVVGTDLTGRIADLEFSTKYYVAVVAVDAGNAYSELSTIKNITTKPNNPPVVTVSSDAPAQIKAWQTVTVPVNIEDPDGHSFTVSLTHGSNADKLDYNIGSNYPIVVKGSGANPGTYTATVTATDAYGASGSANYTYTLLENRAPVIVKDMENIISYKVGDITSYSVDSYVTDPDEEPLSYSFSYSNNGIVHCNISNGKLYVTTLNYGTTSVSVVATDTLGKSVTLTFQILVRDPNSDMVDTYPNPVTTILYVRTGESEVPTTVKLSSSTGSEVYNATSTFSAFSPLAIDMSDCAPGIYSLQVTLNGNTYTKTVVKR